MCIFIPQWGILLCLLISDTNYVGIINPQLSIINHFGVGFITYWIMLPNDFMQKKIITNFAVQMI